MSFINKDFDSKTKIPNGLRLPFPLPIIESKNLKKKCCKKFKKGKQCKRCPRQIWSF